MAEITNSFSGVEKLLANLKPTKAAGPDGITPRVLRELALCLEFSASRNWTLFSQPLHLKLP